MNEQMALICIGCTLIAALPTNIAVFRNRSKLGFLLALFNTSLAFFLFSFQVSLVSQSGDRIIILFYSRSMRKPFYWLHCQPYFC